MTRSFVNHASQSATNGLALVRQWGGWTGQVIPEPTIFGEKAIRRLCG